MAYNIDIQTGIDYDVTFTWNDANGMPIDTSTFTAYMQVRESPLSNNVFFDASPFLIANSDESINGAVRLKIPYFATQSLSALNQGVYDIKLKSNTGDVYLLIDGLVNIKKTITEII